MRCSYLIRSLLLLLSSHLSSSIITPPTIRRTSTITETSPITLESSTTAVIPSSSCHLPESPTNGNFTLLDPSSYIPGSYVKHRATLLVQCNPEITTGGSEQPQLSTCLNGVWRPEIPTCKICPSFKSTPSRNVTCKLRNVILENCENPVDGTTMEFKCADFYEGPPPQFYIPCECRDGSWNCEPMQCRPRCGIKSGKAVTNVISGNDAKHGSYPWQVAVYNKLKEQQCGGAILTDRVVLSAAHCFTVRHNGNLYPKENYIIASGKYYRTFEHPNDTLAQYSGVQAIHVPDRYKGSINHYEADIAIVILETPFSFSVVVQPVCIDILNIYEHEQLIPYNRGWVSGWGQTVEGKEPSEVLKELEIPFIDYNTCYNAVPSNFKSFLTYDKICGGYLDEGKSVCLGDSGGVLAFQNMNDNKFYVRGIVSLSSVQDVSQCNSNQYSLFTKVSDYRYFISRYYKFEN